jgi:hypothetical protein
MAVTTGRGFDLTDEAYYLYSIHDPGRYEYTTTEFGYVYHPIDLLLGGNIQGLRLANLAITVGLGFAATWVALRASGLRQWTRLTQLAVVLSVTCGSLVMFSQFLSTPSYNSLAAQAVLLVAIGVALAREDGFGTQPGQVLVAGTAIGVGGTLLFLAKPPSAVVVAVAAGIVLLFPRPSRWRVAVTAGVLSALTLLLFALSVDGSVGQFVNRLKVGAADDRAIMSSFELGHAFTPQMLHSGSLHKVVFIAMVAAVACATVGIVKRTPLPWAPIAGIALVAAAAGFVAHPELLRADISNPTLALPFLVPPAVAIVLTVRAPKRREAPVMLPLFLLVVPYAVGLGSNSSHWQMAAMAPMAWVLAGCVRMKPLTNQHGVSALAPIAAASFVVVLATVLVNGAHPYRQTQPIWDEGRETKIGPGGSLELPGALSRTIEHLRAGAKDAGFVPGTGILDLTGEAPGLTYALDATAPAAPWLIGGYPGSASRAERELDRATCSDLSRSWVLRAPIGDRALPDNVLSYFGASFPADFTRVAKISTAGVTPEFDGPVELWRPTRTAVRATTECVHSRSEPSSARRS